MLKKSFALIGLTLSVSANAAVIDLGTITRDTATGLDWLDVTETRGLSYNQVSAQLGVGGDYEGYRYATTAELDQLITNFGYVAINQSCPYGLTNCDAYIAGDSSIVEQMIRTLGDTLDAYLDSSNSASDVSPNGAGFTYGLLADSPIGSRPANVGAGMILDEEVVLRRTGEHRYDYGDAAEPAYSFSTTYDGTVARRGSFLVAPSAVPLPAAGWLFMSALVGLFGKKHLQRKQTFARQA